MIEWKPLTIESYKDNGTLLAVIPISLASRIPSVSLGTYLAEARC